MSTPHKARSRIDLPHPGQGWAGINDKDSEYRNCGARFPNSLTKTILRTLFECFGVVMPELSPIPDTDAKIIKNRVFSDGRGSLREAMNDSFLASNEFHVQQVNTTNSREGVFRGFQIQLPTLQAHVVQVLFGMILNFWVDVRVGSPEFGKVKCLPLAAESGDQILIPAGFLHGFYSLKGNTIVMDAADFEHIPEEDVSVRYDDPMLTGYTPEMMVLMSQQFSKGGVLSEKDNRRTRTLRSLMSLLPKY